MAESEVDLKTLQKFCGKCISMCLAVPVCKLFCREVNAAISKCQRNNKNIAVSDSLRAEIEYWRFLDSWSGCSKWRPEFNKRIEVYTDASEFRFGASVKLDNGSIVLEDYWESDDSRPIHEKDADAVLKSMQSVKGFLQDSRVEILSNNMAVIGAWKNQGGRSGPLNGIMKVCCGI